MNKKFLTFAALLSIATLFAVGCGGDDSSSDGGSSSSDEPAPTKAAYIEEADAICADADSALDAIDTESADTAEAQAAVVEEYLALARDLVEQLRALTPPEGDEEATAAIFDAYDDFVDLGEENPGTADQGPVEEVQAKVATLSSEYGFEVCGT
jgi:hypothetical protein